MPNLGFNFTIHTMQKYILTLIIFLPLSFGKMYGQTIPADSTLRQAEIKFRVKSILIPTALIGYGLLGMKSDGLKTLNAEIKEEVNEHIKKKITIDDFSQHAPTVAVYSLNMLGVEGKNNFKNRTLILATSCLIMGTCVSAIKNNTQIQRPDGNGDNSFPSGHTATAFMGAEFLYQEYKDVSIWYGIAGYAVATGTGALRIYNDRHWLTDVAAGAGIGIISTKIAYWINPLLQQKVFKQKKERAVALTFMPYYNGEQTGLGFLLHLN